MKRVKQLFILGFKEYQNKYYQGVAAQLAFYLFLSILPMITLLSQLLGLFSLSMDQLQEWVNINLAGTAMEAISDVLSVKTANAGTNIILILITVWSASKAQFSMTSIADYTFRDYDAPSLNQGLVRTRIRSFVQIVIIIVMLVIVTSIAVYLPAMMSIFFGNNFATSLFSSLWGRLRWIIVTGIYFAMITFIYYITPSKKMTLRMVLPGSIFSSISFIVVSQIYGFCIDYIGNSNIIYGSLSSVVMLLIWLWYVSWVIFFGLILIKEWAVTKNRYPLEEYENNKTLKL